MNRYDVTFNNGSQTTSKGRPKKDGHGYFIFTDVQGNQHRVSQAQIRLIEPHGESEKSFFIPADSR